MPRTKLYNNNLLLEARVHQDQMELAIAWERFCDFMGRAEMINRSDEYLIALFSVCFGYLPDEGMRLRDYGAQILYKDKVIGIIELVNNALINRNLVIARAFARLNEHDEARYVITIDRRILKFYLDYAEQWESFDLENLKFDEFAELYSIINYKSLKSNTPVTMRERTAYREQDISSKLYRNFKIFRMKLFEDMCINNPGINHVIMGEALNKLCDRIIFTIYAEQKGLIPAGKVENLKEQQKTDSIISGSTLPLYSYFKFLFFAMHKGKPERGIAKFNGDLFAPDLLLDSLKISDEVLDLDLIAKYDYDMDVTPDMLSYILSQIYDFEEVFPAQ